MTATLPLTIDDYLINQGIADQLDRQLIAEQYRSAHIARHHAAPMWGWVDTQLADRVVDDHTILICRSCASAWGVQENPAECLNCGLGVVGKVVPSDSGPAGIRVASTRLPVVLGGGPQRCSRCNRLSEPVGYRVQVGDQDVCRYCAADDEQLDVWQRFCDVTEMIDQLMQAAADKGQRSILAALVTNAASNFSEWRWPEDHEVTQPR